MGISCLNRLWKILAFEHLPDRHFAGELQNVGEFHFTEPGAVGADFKVLGIGRRIFPAC